MFGDDTTDCYTRINRNKHFKQPPNLFLLESLSFNKNEKTADITGTTPRLLQHPQISESILNSSTSRTPPKNGWTLSKSRPLLHNTEASLGHVFVFAFHQNNIPEYPRHGSNIFKYKGQLWKTETLSKYMDNQHVRLRSLQETILGKQRNFQQFLPRSSLELRWRRLLLLLLLLRLGISFFLLLRVSLLRRAIFFKEIAGGWKARDFLAGKRIQNGWKLVSVYKVPDYS